MHKGEIIIYKSQNGETSIDVKLEDETVWLNRKQMSLLFDRDVKTIGKHINNAIKEELNEYSVVAKFATTASDGKTYQTEFYNLDVIISVGYRVKSRSGIQFRIWANSVLKNYLIKGYSINEKATKQQLDNLSSMVKILSDSLENKVISNDEAKDVLRIIKDYTYGLDTLDKYDNQILEIENISQKKEFKANYKDAKKVIATLKEKFKAGNLFGNEKDESFKSSINTIYQTFDGKELYPSIEEKAAMFLYLVTKNHSFSDGNKRIAAFLFLWFLSNNELLYRKNGDKLLENNTLVALTLMIAQSKSEEKDTMVKVVVNLINKNN
ncbi:virulence protein RhuM/Fic/DOC family protein [Chryseobacterium gotjawalense]|uniref:Virulence protein RhuM/Fic/DOC family protein n=1 Tax=Chryseobacterium gotjawalense TaxID=3042315 RepID=A0ABY8RID7_9FLAO|nr:virulence protein RhuM/Fic/DOC family protein [Chryseobacterium sp. wdc7]WHF52989.1 virulence protein RhuM/Fic/DOC family protein [Chryseobacterium sp. wdc7]